MIIFKRINILLLICAVLFLTACGGGGMNKKQKAFYAAVDEKTLYPSSVFLAQDSLFLKFDYMEHEVYLKTDGLKNANEIFERHNIALLSAVNPDKDILTGRVEIIPFIQTGLLDLLKKIFNNLAPQGKGEGIIIIVQNNEFALFRGKDGKLNLKTIEKLPQGIKITGGISSKEFQKILLESLLEEIDYLNLENKKFLFAVPGAPLEPYIFVDLDNGLSYSLQLPEYYELRKQMTDIGFSINFIYSFFVKSHFFGIIKAPFTSIHKLLSLAAASVSTEFSPSLKDINPPPIEEGTAPMDIADFERWLEDEIGDRVYKGSARLLIDGEEFFPHFILHALNAKESIFARLFIFGADQYSVKIADMFKDIAKEGVDVRIILDDLNTVLNNLKTPEVTFPQTFTMPGNIKWYLRKKSDIKVRTQLNTWATFDHNKIIIIDRELAYTGGMNFAEEYRYSWHDMMIALRGPVVGKMVKDFYVNWSFTGLGGDFAALYRQIFSKEQRGVNKAGDDMFDIRIFYTSPGDAEIFKAQIEAIRRAKKRIYIQNAYFSNTFLIQELINARERGVDVRIILPAENDINIMHRNNIVIANKLMKNDIKIYFYRGMTHVKAALYDDWALIGSANFDKISLMVNKEMSLGISDPGFVKQLEERLFEVDFENSDLLTEEMDTTLLDHIMSSIASQL